MNIRNLSQKLPPIGGQKRGSLRGSVVKTEVALVKGELIKVAKGGKKRHSKFFELYPSGLICWGDKETQYGLYDHSATVLGIERQHDEARTREFSLRTNYKLLTLTAPTESALRNWINAVNSLLGSLRSEYSTQGPAQDTEALAQPERTLVKGMLQKIKASGKGAQERFFEISSIGIIRWGSKECAQAEMYQHSASILGVSTAINEVAAVAKLKQAQADVFLSIATNYRPLWLLCPSKETRDLWLGFAHELSLAGKREKEEAKKKLQSLDAEVAVLRAQLDAEQRLTYQYKNLYLRLQALLEDTFETADADPDDSSVTERPPDIPVIDRSLSDPQFQDGPSSSSLANPSPRKSLKPRGGGPVACPPAGLPTHARLKSRASLTRARPPFSAAVSAVLSPTSTASSQSQTLPTSETAQGSSGRGGSISKSDSWCTSAGGLQGFTSFGIASLDHLEAQCRLLAQRFLEANEQRLTASAELDSVTDERDKLATDYERTRKEKVDMEETYEQMHKEKQQAVRRMEDVEKTFNEQTNLWAAKQHEYERQLAALDEARANAGLRGRLSSLAVIAQETSTLAFDHELLVLKERNEELRAEVAGLKTQITELEEQLTSARGWKSKGFSVAGRGRGANRG